MEVGLECCLDMLMLCACCLFICTLKRIHTHTHTHREREMCVCVCVFILTKCVSQIIPHYRHVLAEEEEEENR